MFKETISLIGSMVKFMRSRSNITTTAIVATSLLGSVSVMAASAEWDGAADLEHAGADSDVVTLTGNTDKNLTITATGASATVGVTLALGDNSFSGGDISLADYVKLDVTSSGGEFTSGTVTLTGSNGPQIGSLTLSAGDFSSNITTPSTAAQGFSAINATGGNFSGTITPGAVPVTLTTTSGVTPTISGTLDIVNNSNLVLHSDATDTGQGSADSPAVFKLANTGTALDRATTSTNGVKLDITKGTHYIAFTEDFIEDVNVADGGTLASMKGNNSTVLTNLDIDVAKGGVVGTGTEFVEANDSVITYALESSSSAAEQTHAQVGLKGTGNTVQFANDKPVIITNGISFGGTEGFVNTTYNTSPAAATDVFSAAAGAFKDTTITFGEGASDTVLDGIVEDSAGTGNSIVIDDMYVIGGTGFSLVPAADAVHSFTATGVSLPLLDFDASSNSAKGVTINLSNVGNGLDLRGDIILKGQGASTPAALTVSGTHFPGVAIMDEGNATLTLDFPGDYVIPVAAGAGSTSFTGTGDLNVSAASEILRGTNSIGVFSKSSATIIDARAQTFDLFAQGAAKMLADGKGVSKYMSVLTRGDNNSNIYYSDKSTGMAFVSDFSKGLPMLNGVSMIMGAEYHKASAHAQSVSTYKMFVGGEKSIMPSVSFGMIGAVDSNVMTKPDASTKYNSFVLSGFAKKSSFVEFEGISSFDAKFFTSLIAMPKYTIGSMTYRASNVVKFTPELSADFESKDYGLTGSCSASLYTIIGGTNQNFTLGEMESSYRLRNKSGFIGKLEVDKSLTKSIALGMNGIVGSAKTYGLGLSFKFTG